jgi:uncharacterized membrane protein
MKVLMLAALGCIVLALGAAGLAMLRAPKTGEPKSRRMMQALALRVALSVLLFVAILVSYSMGWIRPTGVPLAG